MCLSVDETDCLVCSVGYKLVGTECIGVSETSIDLTVAELYENTLDSTTTIARIGMVEDKKIQLLIVLDHT